MKRTLALLALAALVCLAQPSAMSPDQKLTHALNRLTFGARPGDLERVRAMGLTQWLDEQLHPESTYFQKRNRILREVYYKI